MVWAQSATFSVSFFIALFPGPRSFAHSNFFKVTCEFISRVYNALSTHFSNHLFKLRYFLIAHKYGEIWTRKKKVEIISFGKKSHLIQVKAKRGQGHRWVDGSSVQKPHVFQRQRILSMTLEGFNKCVFEKKPWNVQNPFCQFLLHDTLLRTRFCLFLHFLPELRIIFYFK